MAEIPKSVDQEKGDAVLKRMLKTPPKPHSEKLEDSPKDRPVREKGVGKRRDKS